MKGEKKMKKHSLLALLPFALILTACGGNLKKGSIFNEKLLKRNFISHIETKHEYVAQEKVEVNLEDGATGEVVNAQRDLLKVTKGDYAGYYSLLKDNYPLPLSLELDKATVGYYANGYYRIFYGSKTINEKEVMFIYDDYGNKLYEGEKFDNPTCAASLVAAQEVKENERYRLEVLNSGVPMAFAYYNVDGSFKEVLTREEYYKKNPCLGYGANMAYYGHENLIKNEKYYYSERRVTVFNTKKGKFVSSFAIPESAEFAAIIGDRYIYQTFETLPDRAKKYDVSVGDSKFSINTYSVNYLNGKVKHVKTNLVFPYGGVISAVLNAKGIQQYMYIEGMQFIDKDKVLSPVTRDIILDQNLKEVADVTSVRFTSLRRFGATDYYVNSDHIIYDSKLREVGFVRGNLAEAGPVIRDGEFGLINHKGEYLTDPKYTQVALSAEDHYYYLYSPQSWKFVNINENEELVDIKEISTDDYNKGTYFKKYHEFTRKSDSKVIVVDAITGEERDRIEKPDGSVAQFENQTATRTFQTIDAKFSLYKKDDKFTVIRTIDKPISSYVGKK